MQLGLLATLGVDKRYLRNKHGPWACLTAGRLKTFEPPVGTQRLIVCADNDAQRTGQRAAYALASCLTPRLPVEVRIPENADTD